MVIRAKYTQCRGGIDQSKGDRLHTSSEELQP